jgi:hypothetical protein
MEDPVQTEHLIDFYRSINPEVRADDAKILDLVVKSGVYPKMMRWTQFRESYRGVVKSFNNEMFYFSFVEGKPFKIVKADNPEKLWDANRIMKGCASGVDMTKAEDEKKAGEGLPPASQPEAQAIQDENNQVTDQHPGATVATTPEADDSAARWHGTGHIERALPDLDPTQNAHAWTTSDLLKAWGQHLQTTAPRVVNIDPNQRKFMVSELGLDPRQVDAGKARMNGSQRAQYNEWLTRSLRGRMDGLAGFLRKSRG